jgi:hypothetical protein
MTNQLRSFALSGLFFILFLSVAVAQNYYVSALTGSDQNTGLSESVAFATIKTAVEKVNAGGTVFIMNGTYKSTNGPLLDVKKSGTAGNYIAFKAYPGHYPKLMASGNVWNIIIIDGSYVIVDGLELQGNNANITYADAKASYDSYIAGNRDWAKIANFNTNGISIGSTLDVHHVIIRNCKVHDAAGGGIGGGRCDYVTIENNLVYNNSWYTMYATSGISILNPKSIDQSTAYKIFIRNNICYGNKTTVPWEKIQKLSDGNGIIIDVNTSYVGRTLVENNVSYYNGGGGVHAFKASHVDIINNTAYNNGTVVGYPEIDGIQGSDVKIYNNIMYARTGGNCNSNEATAIYDYNMYYNGGAYRKGTNDVTGDPQFVKVAYNNTADFRLQSHSLAINSGSFVSGQYSKTDINGTVRPAGKAPDRGAYEYTITTGINSASNSISDVIVYPNPADDYIALENTDFSSQIELFDVSGIKVLTQFINGSNEKINISSLQSGIYFLNVLNNHTILYRGKVIKN